MAIFTRRRIQAMIHDLDGHLDASKRGDLVARLNNKRVEQALPAEIELALLWAMSDCEIFEIEPYWWSNERRPDVYTEGLVPSFPAVVEIAATSDNAMSAENDMDHCARLVSEYCDTVKPSIGKYLYFYFFEESRYSYGRLVRVVCASKNYEISEQAKEQIRDWVFDDEARRTKLTVSDGAVRFEVEVRDHAQIRYHNYWTSRPPRTNSLKKNHIFELLSKKVAQLQDAPKGVLKFVFLADVGSKLLNEVGRNRFNNLENAISAPMIINRALEERRGQLDAVVVFSSRKPINRLSGSSRAPHWIVARFGGAQIIGLDAALEKIKERLPKPRWEGYQARSLFRQGSFDHGAKGWYKGISMTSTNEKVTYRISSRLFLDLMAGRISESQFRYFSGEDANQTTILSRMLDRGKTISQITLERGGIDEEDDYIVMEFDDDPAAKKFE
jgi:hypothetical protein